MKEIDYFFSWMSVNEIAGDFEISEEEALRQVGARGMRTQVTRHGELEVCGEDLQAWYDELRNAECGFEGQEGAAEEDGFGGACGGEGAGGGRVGSGFGGAVYS